ncbi:uncharacterized protein LACBIDRAFT_313799 [Laccaria bicolor S238N-H82]|uniref:Ribonuclease H2 subunit B n=1 Tax=Laccaria bicolor (strain S238N-H82 / ATCC MYA-4686) TaxID=486041 RepID=B0D0V7_LACBS|nr:uncharacterized protein LACBIDRAFT_313799 [Laccaria bicolor S238N-H82]EDR11891.1 predicted protein [Laccaria bicolor S238N-H82]|eukprot:XP_001877788.1 predicted protein [Laccaria bicolor S238N-H82]
MNVNFGLLPHDVLDALSYTPSNLVDIRHDSPFLRLPHPRTGSLSLFLSSKVPADASNFKTRIFEVQAVAPPDERSWFIGDEVVADGRLLLMTPIDPTFLLIPILQGTSSQTNFRTADDLFEEAVRILNTSVPSENAEKSLLDTKDVFAFASMSCTHTALRHVCEVKEVTQGIVVYRYSPSRVIDYLRRKVVRLETSGALDVSRTILRTLAKDGLLEDGNEELLKRELSVTSVVKALTKLLSTVGHTRASCDLLAQYLPAHIRDMLLASYDFTKLDIYLKTLGGDIPAPSKAKDAAPVAVEKKRKGAKPSQGVEKLKKVNTTGMSKLSSFFNKAEKTR